MSVQVVNVSLLNNPTAFAHPFQFEITVQCLEALPDDLELRVTYIGSPDSERFDQLLESVFVGPLPVGLAKFVLQADPPDLSKIPHHDLTGVTAVLLTCSYRGQEFIRIGYYLKNEFEDPELNENPPATIQPEQLIRTILDEPRVTRFSIDWRKPVGADPALPMPLPLELSKEETVPMGDEGEEAAVCMGDAGPEPDEPEPEVVQTMGEV
eukprot:gnl/Trimastix_PCT/3250.p1 GENE.gnl/Trimastix_PCT/3250~~gnl/Trimastix_PCT/3250.p1  ORF type:complete len:223 (+),score=29.99 gnl/Trimastix_PCT/3250:41-670(+)